MILWKSAVIVLFLWACENVATSLGSSKLSIVKSSEISYRLRNETYPINYKLNLTTRIDKGDFGFQGNVQIRIGVLRPTYAISINSGSFNITQMQLYNSGKHSHLIPVSYSYNETKEILLISSKEKLEKDQFYILSIFYVGILNEDAIGFYRSWYDDDDNNKVYLATTQFEPTYARFAFPCYDEPKFKATFDISITHGKSYFALSNMAVKQEIDCDNETKTTVFETTVKMSSYLIAFVVSNYDHISKGNQRVFTEPKLIRNADFALDAGIKILDALETYLNVSYSINKMDQVSIPHFADTGMENWGLIIYKKARLHYDPAVDSIVKKISIAKLIAHEFAHQWFGNLVSPDWWTYLWLKEGFARLFETEVLQITFPELRADEIDIIELEELVFEGDTSVNIRPMSTYAEDPTSIKDLFDKIAYDKSAFVLRMTKNFLTEPVWKDGLNQYLNSRAFTSARDTDLFDALQTAVDSSNVTLPTSVTEILNTWTLNRGFPLISVKRIGEGLHFSQKRFLNENSTDPDNELWWAPINIATKSNPDFSNTAADFWFNASKQFYIPPEKIKPDDWFLVNKRAMYYYKVNYDPENWQKLTQELNNGNYKNIDSQNRAQLLNDVLSLAKDDQMDYGLALNVVKYLNRETEYVPWGVFDNPMSELYRKVEAVIQTDHLIHFMGELSEKLYKIYGPVTRKLDSYPEKMARFLAIKWACKSENEQCLADTHQLLIQFAYNDIELDPETRESVVCGGLRSANQTTVDLYLNKIKSTFDFKVRTNLLESCSCIKYEDILLQTIGNILGDSSFSYFDKGTFVEKLFMNSHFGSIVLWKYIANNWQTLLDVLRHSIQRMALYIYRPEEESFAMDIINKLNFSDDFKNSFKEKVATNLAWVSSRYNEIDKFLTVY